MGEQMMRSSDGSVDRPKSTPIVVPSDGPSDHGASD